MMINDWLIAAGEWAILLPIWRRFIRPRGIRGAAAIGTAAVWLGIIAVVAGAAGDNDANYTRDQAAPRASATVTPKRTGRQTRTPRALPTLDSTPAATSSPTAASGQEPTDASGPPSADSEETPAPPGEAHTLRVVSSSSYVDDVGTLHVAGEVRNDGSEYLEFVEITGTFFDAAEQVVGSEYTYTHADLVGPSEAAGFDLPVPNGGNLGVARYELAVQGEIAVDRPAAGLVIQGASSSIDSGGDYHVVGTVMNQSSAPAEFVKVIGTFYAVDGTVVRSDFAYTQLDTIDSGGSDTFDLSVPNGGSAGIARYSLKVEGFPI